MKKVEAIIREEKLDAVKKALEEKGFVGLTISEVSGRGRQKGIPLQWRVGEYRVELLPKIKVDIVVKDGDAERVMDAIVKSAWTGNIGDGKLFVLPVAEVARIRTGERGEEAI